MARKQWIGFTLAELLIALAILAEISTFTIPKIINAQQSSLRKAVLKETIGALNEAVYYTCITPTAANGLNEYNYLISKLNTRKQCPTDAVAQGCSPPSTIPETVGAVGFVLSNGAAVIGFDNVPSWPLPTNNGFLVDWNGLAGPNVVGDDQFWLGANYSIKPSWMGVKTCTVGPIFSTALTEYEAIFY